MVRNGSIMLCGVVVMVLFAPLARADDATPIDFERQVRPLLAAHCLKCHGPDQQEGGLRLDAQSGALAKLDSGARAVVPGNLEASELLRRVTSLDADTRMPPAEAGRGLSGDEVSILASWIGEGAPWRTHWSLVPPVRPEVPAVSDASWPRNAIDAFILARLGAEGLKPAPEASRETLLRRVCLDLVGLPPTPEQREAFLADERADAYEHLVDDLLASPQYGVRQAIAWLDLARYSDTEGYAHDRTRTIWPYRDWVVDALNADMPYDQFTIEQLAGDLLPEPTRAQQIATGLHRNSRINVEAGVDPEEFRYEAVIDRVNTTATVWLAATLGCAQCHTHKYDPYAHREYYQLLAYFNQCDVETTRDLSGKITDVSARMEYLSPADEARRAQLESQLSAACDETVRDAIQEQLDAIKPIAMLVMRDLEQPRSTRLFQRGSFHQPGDEVSPGVPTVFDMLPPPAGDDRLALARWLVDPRHPLTARVAANRLWQQLYGRGLVETPDDFGVQGALPTHPQLLDWLATEFMESGWHRKPLVRLLVTSATYRQASVTDTETIERDPDNHLLARATRLRLPAEIVRDHALAIGGLLDESAGGPPIHASKMGRDDEPYRRSLYLFWKRQLLDEMLVTFDAPTRDVCTARRLTTSTPLQSLNLLNDRVFLDAARGLASRAIDAASNDPERLAAAFSLCLARQPSADESRLLLELLARRRAEFEQDAAAAEALIAQERLTEISAAEQAAWILLANVLLNLDETYTRP